MFVSLKQTMIQVIFSIIAINYGSQRSHQGTISITYIFEYLSQSAGSQRKDIDTIFLNYIKNFKWIFQKIGCITPVSFTNFSIYMKCNIAISNIFEAVYS